MLTLQDSVYITKVQLAKQLAVTPRTVENWMAAGEIPFIKIGHTVRFDWGAVRRRLNGEASSGQAEPRPTTAGTSREKLKSLAKQIRKAAHVVPA